MSENESSIRSQCEYRKANSRQGSILHVLQHALRQATSGGSERTGAERMDVQRVEHAMVQKGGEQIAIKQKPGCV